MKNINAVNLGKLGGLAKAKISRKNFNFKNVKDLDERKKMIFGLKRKGKTDSEIAKILGTSRQRIGQIIHNYQSPSTLLRIKKNPEDIKILNKRRRKFLGLPSGKINTKGGGLDYIRELVRMRDKHTCQKCGKNVAKNGNLVKEN